MSITNNPVVREALRSMRSNGDLASVMVLADILTEGKGLTNAQQERVHNAVMDAVQGLYVDLAGVLHHDMDNEDVRSEDYKRSRKLLGRHYKDFLDVVYREGMELVDDGEIGRSEELREWVEDRVHDSRWVTITYLQDVVMFVSEKMEQAIEEHTDLFESAGHTLSTSETRTYLVNTMVVLDVLDKFERLLEKWRDQEQRLEESDLDD